MAAPPELRTSPKTSAISALAKSMTTWPASSPRDFAPGASRPRLRLVALLLRARTDLALDFDLAVAMVDKVPCLPVRRKEHRSDPLLRRECPITQWRFLRFSKHLVPALTVQRVLEREGFLQVRNEPAIERLTGDGGGIPHGQ